MHVHERYSLWIGEIVVDPAATPLSAATGTPCNAGGGEERRPASSRLIHCEAAAAALAALAFLAAWWWPIAQPAAAPTAPWCPATWPATPPTAAPFRHPAANPGIDAVIKAMQATDAERNFMVYLPEKRVVLFGSIEQAGQKMCVIR
jgi:hypothetical protein